MDACWRLHPADPHRADRLAEESGLHPITAQLLLNRGVTTRSEVSRFFHPTLESLGDPVELPDMSRAVVRLRHAVARREPILIFSDSDVDGLTGSVLLYEVLHELGAVVRAKQSNRIADGYGLPSSVVSSLRRSSTKLLILVDCGTNQSEAVQILAAHGIDTIIVDHHVPLDQWATPYALVNPHRDRASAYRGLSSAGLALKVIQALLSDRSPEQLAAHLDLAALGTLADCSPLVRDNRVIVSQGLERIVNGTRPGLRRLCQATRTSGATPNEIVRRLVPRLNASGRLGDPGAVWHLLLRQPHERLEEWMEASEAAHMTTKQLHRQIMAEAQEQVNRLHFRDEYILMVGRDGWHQGLMGPLASQLAQRYGRPAIALAMQGRQAIGSGRSVPHFNLLDALKTCHGLLVRFGGHAQACGLMVDVKHMEEVRALLNQQARVLLGRAGLLKTQTLDLELPLNAVTPEWVKDLEQFAPFGAGNPRPTVVIRHLRIEAQSARTARLSDGTRCVAAKGRFPTIMAEGRYDVVATPTMVGAELVLTVSDVRVSTAP